MEGVNNAFCMSKEQYELARLATKCAGLQGKIDDQAAEISRLKGMVDEIQSARHVAWQHNELIAQIHRLNTLCDQMGREMEAAIPNLELHADSYFEALNAWREMK